MENHNGFDRSRQTLVAQLLAWSEHDSLRKPDSDRRYLCVIRNDCTHWPGMPGEQMAVVASAKREFWFNLYGEKIGICQGCFDGERKNKEGTA